MDAVRDMFTALLSLLLVRNALCALLPEGGMKAIVRYVFSLIQMLKTAELMLKLMDLLMKVQR